MPETHNQSQDEKKEQGGTNAEKNGGQEKSFGKLGNRKN
jgi:hypothetical protein